MLAAYAMPFAIVNRIIIIIQSVIMRTLRTVIEYDAYTIHRRFILRVVCKRAK